MKYIYELLAEIAFGTIVWFQNLYRFIACRPEPQPSLLALNVDWFTNCSWLHQLIAFKQIDIYYFDKH